MIELLQYEEAPNEDHVPAADPFQLLRGITDVEYKSFLQSKPRGGFFFYRSLHLYGINDFVNFNKLLRDSYGPAFNDLIAFGQDLFGHQFCFTSTQQVVHIDLESLLNISVADCFSEFEKVMLDPSNFLTGWQFAEAWIRKYGTIFDFTERLSPNIPLIVGGELSIENLHIIDSNINIQYCASIWHQIKDLPNGTKIRLKIIPPSA